jgi:hypothetical protein
MLYLPPPSLLGALYARRRGRNNRTRHSDRLDVGVLRSSESFNIKNDPGDTREEGRDVDSGRK